MLKYCADSKIEDLQIGLYSHTHKTKQNKTMRTDHSTQFHQLLTKQNTVPK